jgi:serine/threonine-protein kinase
MISAPGLIPLESQRKARNHSITRPGTTKAFMGPRTIEPMPSPSTGDLLFGKYRLVAELGRGAMGIVFRAINIATEGEVALKVLNDSRHNREHSVIRMFREARSAARLRSRFVARVFDFDRTRDGDAVLVMELLEGHSLDVELRRRGRLDVSEAVSYVLQACAALGEAHELGMVHRDLKPANLFVDTRTQTPTLRVLDFGLAKSFRGEDIALTEPKMALGTLSHMSPEQIRGASAVDARCDVWALGMVLHRALTGSLPFNARGGELVEAILDPAPVPVIVDPLIPRELALVVARALSKSPAHRFANARELAQALRPFIGSPTPMAALALDELGMAIVMPAFSTTGTVMVLDADLEHDPEADEETALGSETGLGTEIHNAARSMASKRRPIFAALASFATVVVAGTFLLSPTTHAATPPPATFPPPAAVVLPPPTVSAPVPVAQPPVVKVQHAHPKTRPHHR